MQASEPLYIGVDVGATKILASLAQESGEIIASVKNATPHKSDAETVYQTIVQTIGKLLKKQEVEPQRIAAVGLAIPGVVDVAEGRITIAPNLDLHDFAMADRLAEDLGFVVAMGNDCNVGILGERWLGAARQADSAVGIFVGTGIGGGFVQHDHLWTGRRDAALEIGHMVMQLDGPVCGCGNRGCFEALASRTAIERDIRAAHEEGRKCMIFEDGNPKRIKSGKLAKALKAGDKVVTEVITHAAEIIGWACQNINHLYDPHLIVIGGGVMEACGDYFMPIIDQIVKADPLPGSKKIKSPVLAELGDDAVVLGAVALARMKVDRSPFAQNT